MSYVRSQMISIEPTHPATLRMMDPWTMGHHLHQGPIGCSGALDETIACLHQEGRIWDDVLASRVRALRFRIPRESTDVQSMHSL